MDYRCIYCGTRSHVSVSRIICDEDIECEHCHERDCNQCEMRYEYEVDPCSICGSTKTASASHFRQCNLCLNMYYTPLHSICPYCVAKKPIAKLLHSTFPYQNDISKRLKREAIFTYLRLCAEEEFDLKEESE